MNSVKSTLKILKEIEKGGFRFVNKLIALFPKIRTHSKKRLIVFPTQEDERRTFLIETYPQKKNLFSAGIRGLVKVYENKVEELPINKPSTIKSQRQIRKPNEIRRKPRRKSRHSQQDHFFSEEDIETGETSGSYKRDQSSIESLSSSCDSVSESSSYSSLSSSEGEAANSSPFSTSESESSTEEEDDGNTFTLTDLRTGICTKHRLYNP